MAGKFVDLKEAAKMLGCTPEELVEMRSHGDISGYRDGSSWKFKIEEVERVMADKGGKSGTGSGVGSGVLENDEDFDEIIKTGLSSKTGLSGAKASDSVLITEQELGHSAEGTSSTIIGKGEKAAGPADSDLKLAEGLSDVGTAGSDKLLEAPGSRLKAPDKADVLGGDLKIAGGSGTGEMPVKTGSGTGDMPVKTGSGTGDMPKAAGGVEMSDELDLESSEELDLGEDLQLAGSGKKKGSDVTLGAGDSGINLKPSDSGLNLEEEPLDLGSGSAIESLELPEDDEVISLSEEAVDQDEATQLKADDQFMLSPSDNLQEDESDSGSQVIALEDSAAFDENAATLLKQEQPVMLGEEAFGSPVAMPEQPMAGTMAPAYGAAPIYVPPVEAPYSIWNVLGLMVTAALLALCGMLMVDVMMNMWSWNGATAPVSSGIMDAFLGMFGLK
jgi:excisionase family DNA binding protein